MQKIKALFLKYKSYLSYLFFGALTTLVNQGVYALCFHALGLANLPSAALAWLFAVLFAFVTNKLWVFESKSWDCATLKRELPAFFGARAATGIMDLLIMYLTVDLAGWNADLMKLLSNVLVIILNYVASKWLVFRKKQDDK